MRWLLLLLLATPTWAAPPPGTDLDGAMSHWYQSLTDPKTGGSCCSEADCRAYKVRPMGDHFEVWFEGKWLIAPPDVVLRNITNPTGGYIACVNPNHYENGDISPAVLCIVPGTGS